MAARFSGIFVATVTPFTASGELDEKAFGELLDFEISAGVDGIYACGTTGEGVSMTVAQRKRVAEIVRSHAGSKVTAMTQVGDEAIENVRELAKHAEDIGMDGVAALTPYYYKPDEASVLDYYRSVSSFSNLPLFIYHIPPMTGLTLPPHTIVKIMQEIPNIKGIKDSSGDFRSLLEILYHAPKGQAVFTGTDEYAAQGFMSGISGCVSGYSSVFPELYVSLYSNFRKGNMKGALEMQQKIAQAKAFLRTPYIQAIKEALKLRGVNGGFVKSPLRKMSETEIKELAAGLRNLGLLK